MRLSPERNNAQHVPQDKVVMTASNKPDFAPIRAPREDYDMIDGGYDDGEIMIMKSDRMAKRLNK
jgi:hypothetical protein